MSVEREAGAVAALNLKLPPLLAVQPGFMVRASRGSVLHPRHIFTENRVCGLGRIRDPGPGPHPPHPRHDTVRHTQTPTHHPHRPPRTTAPPAVTQFHRVGRSKTHTTSPSHAATAGRRCCGRRCKTPSRAISPASSRQRPYGLSLLR